MSRTSLILWLAWIAAFFVIEGFAIWDGNPRSITLSQFVWRITVHPVPYVCLAVFIGWLALHLLSKGRIG